jgi:hypothetical protein
MDLGWQLSLLPYGDTWRRGRKLLHTHVNLGALLKYRSTQLHAARRFSRDVLIAKQDDHVLRRMLQANVGQTIVKLVYGIDVKDTESEHITLAEKVVSYVHECTIPGRFLVEFFPICEYSLKLRLLDVAHFVGQ